MVGGPNGLEVLDISDGEGLIFESRIKRVEQDDVSRTACPALFHRFVNVFAHWFRTAGREPADSPRTD